MIGVFFTLAVATTFWCALMLLIKRDFGRTWLLVAGVLLGSMMLWKTPKIGIVEDFRSASLFEIVSMVMNTLMVVSSFGIYLLLLITLVASVIHRGDS